MKSIYKPMKIQALIVAVIASAEFKLQMQRNSY